MPVCNSRFYRCGGCSNVSVSKRINTIRYEVQARFILELQLKDIDLLLKIQSFVLWSRYNY